MIEKLREKITIQQIRSFFFILAILFYLSAYLSFDAEIYPLGSSSFLDLLGSLSLLFISDYKIKEEPLKIHRLIESKIKNKPQKSYLYLAIISTVISLIGSYFSYRNIYQLDYLSKSNAAFQRIFIFFIMFTFSLWSRRKILKEKKNK